MSDSSSSNPADAEGFRASFAVPGEDDVEGHRLAAVPEEADESDDVEGHRTAVVPDEEDDVEGHQKLVP